MKIERIVEHMMKLARKNVSVALQLKAIVESSSLFFTVDGVRGHIKDGQFISYLASQGKTIRMGHITTFEFIEPMEVELIAVDDPEPEVEVYFDGDFIQ